MADSITTKQQAILGSFDAPDRHDSIARLNGSPEVTKKTRIMWSMNDHARSVAIVEAMSVMKWWQGGANHESDDILLDAQATLCAMWHSPRAESWRNAALRHQPKLMPFFWPHYNAERHVSRSNFRAIKKKLGLQGRIAKDTALSAAMTEMAYMERDTTLQAIKKVPIPATVKVPTENWSYTLTTVDPKWEKYLLKLPRSKQIEINLLRAQFSATTRITVAWRDGDYHITANVDKPGATPPVLAVHKTRVVRRRPRSILINIQYGTAPPTPYIVMPNTDIFVTLTHHPFHFDTRRYLAWIVPLDGRKRIISVGSKWGREGFKEGDTCYISPSGKGGSGVHIPKEFSLDDAKAFVPATMDVCNSYLLYTNQPGVSAFLNLAARFSAFVKLFLERIAPEMANTKFGMDLLGFIKHFGGQLYDAAKLPEWLTPTKLWPLVMLIIPAFGSTPLAASGAGASTQALSDMIPNIDSQLLYQLLKYVLMAMFGTMALAWQQADTLPAMFTFFKRLTVTADHWENVQSLLGMLGERVPAAFAQRDISILWYGISGNRVDALAKVVLARDAGFTMETCAAAVNAWYGLSHDPIDDMDAWVGLKRVITDAQLLLKKENVRALELTAINTRLCLEDIMRALDHKISEVNTTTPVFAFGVVGPPGRGKTSSVEAIVCGAAKATGCRPGPMDPDRPGFRKPPPIYTFVSQAFQQNAYPTTEIGLVDDGSSIAAEHTVEMYKAIWDITSGTKVQIPKADIRSKSDNYYAFKILGITANVRDMGFAEFAKAGDAAWPRRVPFVWELVQNQTEPVKWTSPDGYVFYLSTVVYWRYDPTKLATAASFAEHCLWPYSEVARFVPEEGNTILDQQNWIVRHAHDAAVEWVESKRGTRGIMSSLAMTCFSCGEHPAVCKCSTAERAAALAKSTDKSLALRLEPTATPTQVNAANVALGLTPLEPRALLTNPINTARVIRHNIGMTLKAVVNQGLQAPDFRNGSMCLYGDQIEFFSTPVACAFIGISAVIEESIVYLLTLVDPLAGLVGRFTIDAVAPEVVKHPVYYASILAFTTWTYSLSLPTRIGCHITYNLALYSYTKCKSYWRQRMLMQTIEQAVQANDVAKGLVCGVAALCFACAGYAAITGITNLVKPSAPKPPAASQVLGDIPTPATVARAATLTAAITRAHGPGVAPVPYSTEKGSGKVVAVKLGDGSEVDIKANGFTTKLEVTGTGASAPPSWYAATPIVVHTKTHEYHGSCQRVADGVYTGEHMVPADFTHMIITTGMDESVKPPRPVSITVYRESVTQVVRFADDVVLLKFSCATRGTTKCVTTALTANVGDTMWVLGKEYPIVAFTPDAEIAGKKIPGGSPIIPFPAEPGLSGTPVLLGTVQGVHNFRLAGVISRKVMGGPYKDHAVVGVFAPPAPAGNERDYSCKYCFDEAALNIYGTQWTVEGARNAYHKFYKKQLVNRIHPSSVLQHLSPQEMQGVGMYVGSNMSYTPSRRENSIVPSEFHAAAVRLDPKVAEYAPTHLHGHMVGGNWVSPVLGTLRQLSNRRRMPREVNVVRAMKVVENELRLALRAFTPHFQPLSVQETFAGTPLSNPMHLDTAAGGPLSGTKALYVDGIKGDITPKGEFLEQLIETNDMLNRGELVPNFCTLEIKAEVIALTKTLNGQDRGFYKGWMTSLFWQRMYFCPFMDAVMAMRGESFAQLGMNANGAEFHELFKRLMNDAGHEFDPTEPGWLDTDAQSFDKMQSLFPYAVEIMTNIIADSPYYQANPEVRARMLSVAESMKSWIMVAEGDVFLMEGVNPSGGWGTTVLNSIVERMYKVLMFGHVYTSATCGEDTTQWPEAWLHHMLDAEDWSDTFFTKSILVEANYGDDAIWYIAQRFRAWFTTARINAASLWLGIFFTPGIKGATSFTFMPATLITFLQRALTLVDDMWVGRLNIHSISKMIAFKETDDPAWGVMVQHIARREVSWWPEHWDKWAYEFQWSPIDKIDETRRQYAVVAYGHKWTACFTAFYDYEFTPSTPILPFQGYTREQVDAFLNMQPPGSQHEIMANAFRDTRADTVRWTARGVAIRAALPVVIAPLWEEAFKRLSVVGISGLFPFIAAEANEKFMVHGNFVGATYLAVSAPMHVMYSMMPYWLGVLCHASWNATAVAMWYADHSHVTLVADNNAAVVADWDREVRRLFPEYITEMSSTPSQGDTKTVNN